MNEKYEWRTGRNCIYNIKVHLVFITKYRRDVFSSIMLDRMKDIFTTTCRQMDSVLLEFGGEDDHVHLIVEFPPKLALANLIGKLKGKSSFVLRKEFKDSLEKKLWGGHLWSPSYCAVSCGGAPLEVVKQYIQNQRIPPSTKSIKTSIALTGRKKRTKGL